MSILSNEQRYISAIRNKNIKHVHSLSKDGVNFDHVSRFASPVIFMDLKNAIKDHKTDVVRHFIDNVPLENKKDELSRLCATAIRVKEFDLAEYIVKKHDFGQDTYLSLANVLTSMSQERKAQSLIQAFSHACPSFDKHYQTACLAAACKNHNTGTAKKLLDAGAVLQYSHTIDSCLNSSLRQNDNAHHATNKIMIEAFDRDHYKAISLAKRAILGKNSQALLDMVQAEWPFKQEHQIEIFDYAIQNKATNLAKALIDICTTGEMADHFYFMACRHGQDALINHKPELFELSQKDAALQTKILSDKIAHEPLISVKSALTKKDGSVIQLPDCFLTIKRRACFERNIDNLAFLLQTQDLKNPLHYYEVEMRQVFRSLEQNKHLKDADKQVFAQMLYQLECDSTEVQKQRVFTKYTAKQLQSKTQGNFLLSALPKLDESTWNSEVHNALFTQHDIVTHASTEILNQLTDKSAHFDSVLCAAATLKMLTRNREDAALYAIEAYASQLKHADLVKLQVENIFSCKSTPIKNALSAIMHERMYSDDEKNKAHYKAFHTYVSAHTRSLSSEDLALLTSSLELAGKLQHIPDRFNIHNTTTHLIGRENYDAASYLIAQGMPFPQSGLTDLLNGHIRGREKPESYHKCFQVACDVTKEITSPSVAQELIRGLKYKSLPSKVFENLIDIGVMAHIKCSADLSQIEINMLKSLDRDNHDIESRLSQKFSQIFNDLQQYFQDKENTQSSHAILQRYAESQNVDPSAQEKLKEHLSQQFTRICASKRPLVDETMKPTMDRTQPHHSSKHGGSWLRKLIRSPKKP